MNSTNNELNRLSDWKYSTLHSGWTGGALWSSAHANSEFSRGIRRAFCRQRRWRNRFYVAHCENGRKQTQELDGKFYIGSQFQDTVLTYNGGKVGFDGSNRVTNSVLVVAPLIRPDDATVRRLAQEFT